MFKKTILLIVGFILLFTICAFGNLSGTYSPNSLFYKPGYGAYGIAEWEEYNKYIDIADAQITENKTSISVEHIQDVAGFMWTGNTETFVEITYQDVDGTVDAVVPVKDEDDMASNSATFLCTQQSIKAYADTLHALQYLKTEIDTLGEIETIYTKDITDSDELAAALGAYYLKTEMDSFSELQAIIADKTLVNTTDKLNVFAVTSSAELAGVINDETGSGLLVYGTSPNITTPTGIVKGDIGLGNVENLKVKLDATSAPGTGNDNTEGYAVGSRWIDVTNDKEYVALDVSTGAAVWTETTGAGGGATTFTGLTDTPANYTGSSLKHVRVNVGETALEFVTLGGGGDMLKATYDTDEDGDIDVAAGGTEKSAWTQYAIPYLSDTTVFGEIPIGTAEYALTVAAGATGYDWTLFDLSLYYLKTQIDTQGEIETIWGDTLMNDLVDDPDPELGGEMDAGAHSIGFTLGTATGDGATLIDWTAGNKFKFTFGAMNETITFTNPTNPGAVQIIIVQDGVGSRTITWSGMTFKWHGGVEPTLSTAANAEDVISAIWDGTSYYGQASLVFAVP